MKYYVCIRDHNPVLPRYGNSFTNCLENKERGRYSSFAKFTVGRIYKSFDDCTIRDDEGNLFILKDINDCFVDLKFELDEKSRTILTKMKNAGLYARVEPVSVAYIGDASGIIPVCLLYVSSTKHHFSEHVYYTLDNERSTVESLYRLWKKMRVCSDMATSIAKGLNLKIALYIEHKKVF